MELGTTRLLEALQPYTGKSGTVELEGKLLEACVDELKDKQQMAKDLEQARDEASMKPSVARKLNERIRSLEAELEQLRTNKKVKELEKKVQFLEQELKQSYTTKNFTLKSGLLELEKQYRAHMNVDPAMAAFWADVTVLLDEKKDKDAPAQFKGPPALGTASSQGSRCSTSGGADKAPTADTDGSSQANTEASTELAAGGSSGGAAAVVSSNGPPAAENAAAAAEAAGKRDLQSHPPSGVQLQVETFNSIISDEAASAATILQTPSDVAASSRSAADVKLGGSFKIVKTQQPVEGGSSAAAAAESCEVEESLQPVRLVKDSYSSKLEDVTFQPLPASFRTTTAIGGSSEPAEPPSPAAAATAAAAAAAEVPKPVDACALEQVGDAVCASIDGLREAFGRISSEGGAALPTPPLLPAAAAAGAGAGTGTENMLEQLDEAGTDTSSLWQQQIDHLLAAAQQLKAAASGGSAAQNHQDTAGLMAYVLQLREALAASSRQQEVTAGSAAAAVDNQLESVHQELLQMQQLQQQASREAGSQKLLVQVFGEFISQLEQQGVMTGGRVPGGHTAAAGVAGAAAGVADGSVQEQQHMLLDLLQQFLRVNPEVPQLLVAQLTPPPAPAPAAAPAPPAATTAVGVQQTPDTSHASTQAEADSTHVSTQSEPLPSPSVHASTQAELVAETSHVEVQCEPQPSPASHISTQTSLVESVAAATQPSPPDSPVHASVQATEARPALVHASSQTDLQIGGAAADSPATDSQAPAAAEDGGGGGGGGGDHFVEDIQQQQQGVEHPAAFSLPPAPHPSALSDEELQAGSGIIYGVSGGELPVSKVAVGQQLDILHHLQRRTASQSSTGQPTDAPASSTASAVGKGGGDSGDLASGAVAVDVSEGGVSMATGVTISESGISGGVTASDAGAELVSAVVDVRPEELTDLQSVAQELSKLRADNLELAASLQVTKSLVDHLNSSLKSAVDKADDAEADTAQTRHQLEAAQVSLQQLQHEHAELTHLLIEAKVEIAERKGELVKLVRNLRRAVEQPTSTAGMVKELRDILAVVPNADSNSDPPSPKAAAAAAAPAGSSLAPARTTSLDLAAGRQALAGLAAGLGSTLSGMRASSLRRGSSDTTAGAAAALAADKAAAAADKEAAAPGGNDSSQ